MVIVNTERKQGFGDMPNKQNPRPGRGSQVRDLPVFIGSLR